MITRDLLKNVANVPVDDATLFAWEADRLIDQLEESVPNSAAAA